MVGIRKFFGRLERFLANVYAVCGASSCAELEEALGRLVCQEEPEHCGAACAPDQNKIAERESG